MTNEEMAFYLKNKEALRKDRTAERQMLDELSRDIYEEWLPMLKDATPSQTQFWFWVSGSDIAEVQHAVKVAHKKLEVGAIVAYSNDTLREAVSKFIGKILRTSRCQCKCDPCRKCSVTQRGRDK